MRARRRGAGARPRLVLRGRGAVAGAAEPQRQLAGRAARPPDDRRHLLRGAVPEEGGAAADHRRMTAVTPFRPLALGKIAVGMPAVQAALSGYSDLAMRTVAREHGAPYALNEVVLDEVVLQKGKLQRRILSVPEHDHPVGGQLMGSDPARFGAAARELVKAGYDVVDVNFGCPVNKVLG
ncbi:MAG: hypothetical protein FJ306_12410, partial [Planctomycetes bacterium]|nr:hypothetical protein [Planctomycetota bacterium]